MLQLVHTLDFLFDLLAVLLIFKYILLSCFYCPILLPPAFAISLSSFQAGSSFRIVCVVVSDMVLGCFFFVDTGVQRKLWCA